MALDLSKIKNTYPFLSAIKISNEEKIGIIQNCDMKILSIYCYDKVSRDLQPIFLEYGKNWWWESNRKIPVNMFIGKDFDMFQSSLRSYSYKETQIIFGPVTKLSDLIVNKRIRKKTVQLIRQVN